jgi:hypothetical protein
LPSLCLLYASDARIYLYICFTLRYYDFRMNLQHPPGLPLALYWVTPRLKGWQFSSLRQSARSCGFAHVVHGESVWRNRNAFSAALHLRCAGIESKKFLGRVRDIGLDLRHGPFALFQCLILVGASQEFEGLSDVRNPIVSDELQDWT